MVYYHTSGNVKLLRNIILDYGASKELSPYEYMKTYTEKCPENIDESKIMWIAKTFLEIQKQGQFLKSLASHLSEELSEEDQDYFMILFHAVVCKIDPKDMQFLYKCIFNLSKSLLSTFTTFLANNEVLAFISHVAQPYYDTYYITEKIIAPLFSWQPYISEMGHNYGEYLQKIESRKTKPKTIPVQPNVLNRKTLKNTTLTMASYVFPATPPNSLKQKHTKKMLTKNVIDQKLKQMHEKNQQKAAHLLNDVKTLTKDFNFAQDQTETYNKKISAIRDEIENEYAKPTPKPRQKFVMKHNAPPIKETTATLKRMNKKIQLAEQDEIQWLSDLVNSCKPTNQKAEELKEFEREQIQKEKIYEMERKRLEVQISYEEAVIAKKKVEEENKKRHEDFLKEKELWEEKIENWKKSEIERNRINVEKLSMHELNLKQAKLDVLEKNKNVAGNIRQELDSMYEKSMRQKQEELEKRMILIKEMKILAMIAKKAKVPKVIDLTETSGFGFLCEMSMAELQERLNAMKIDLKDELNRKKELIKEENCAAKKEIEKTKESINTFITERALVKKRKKKVNVTLNGSSAKEIENLKHILEEKKKLRVHLTS